MFTGLVETVAPILDFSNQRLSLQRPQSWELSQGDSVSVDGCCLTVVDFDEKQINFEVSEETLTKTHFQNIDKTHSFNLERAMRLDGRLGGHMVLGHVDTVGEMVSMNKTGDWHELVIGIQKSFEELVISKGSLCVQGISLTINAIESFDDCFTVSLMIIPHTFQVTNLHQAAVGQKVNIEFDVLGKYVQRIMSLRSR
jgi:riboflavin synthase